MKQEYTLTIFSENQIELLTKTAAMFSKRKINLESLNSSPTEIKKTYRFTIVVWENEMAVKDLLHQIEKIIGVFECYYNTNDEIFWQQMVLYKIPTSVIIQEEKVEQLAKQYGAKIKSIQKDYTLFEATGQDNEIDNLLTELEQYGLVEFVKSPRIVLIKSSDGIPKKWYQQEKIIQEKKLQTINY